MQNNPLRGAAYLMRGAAMLTEPGLRRFVVIPLLINVLLFGAAIWLLVREFGGWVESWLASMPEWLGFLDWLLWPLFALMILIGVWFGFGVVAGLVAAPFNGILSERVEQRLRGVSPPELKAGELPALVIRTLGRELSKLAWYLPRVVGLLVLSFIPGLQILAPPLWLLFGAWMMAIQYIDYPMDNNRISFAEMRRMLGRQRFAALGFGGLAYGWMLIPVLNLVLMPAAVCGATLFWVERFADEARTITVPAASR